MEELLRALPGVVDTTVGYTGGTADKPGYNQVKTGRSGHAESVQLTFDPSRISYQQIVEYFFTIHDPTTENRQGNDVGTQYRSALFVQNAEQRRVAEAVIARVEASGAWKQPITTQVVEATAFHPAESYHQDYLKKNPGGYTCHFERDISFD
jgi:methionine-S-sulfoxide reductase